MSSDHWHRNNHAVSVMCTRKSEVYLTPSLAELIYVNRTPFTILSANRQTSPIYNMLMQRTTGVFKELKARDKFLTIDENCLTITISIVGVTPTGCHHLHRLLNNKKYKHFSTSLHINRPDEFVVHNIVSHRQTTIGL